MGTRALPRPASRPTAGVDRWNHLRTSLHSKLVSALTPEQLKNLSKDGVRDQIATVADKLISETGLPMTTAEKDRLIEEVLDEVFGLGPLEPLMQDASVSDIMVNGFDSVYVERGGQLIETNVRFKDQAHLRMIIDRIVSNIGRRIDDSSPIVDARLADGSRVCAVIPPLSLIGPVMSIRRFGKKLLGPDDLMKNLTLTPGMLHFLEAAVKARLNVIISGGSGSGKTTLLNNLSRYIPEEERVVTIEDIAELQVQQEHLVRLETRPVNIEGAGGVTQRDLVINALRMRPDRILIGECRGGEALDMMQAMNTGHDGSMTTCHANTARDAFSRLETMVMMASSAIPDRVIRQMLASAVQIVVQVLRLIDGSRKILSISEVTGVQEDFVELKDVFVFDREGVNAQGKAIGQFRATGYMPICLERMRSYGQKVDEKIFTELVRVGDRG